ncbi:MAG: type II secretion system protein [Deltaproteobacteria bacterium]|nr:type II secretion system protein [Deltaproteobacteria bacterium]
MRKSNAGRSHEGFTLLELLAVAMILSVLTVISLNLYNAAQARNRNTETRNRLALIEATIKQYYRAHEKLPAPPFIGSSEVPVEALDLVQKYRLDASGHFLTYNPGNVNNIRDILNPADGILYAAVVESGGADQNPLTDPDNQSTYIDLTAEAKDICRKKLMILQEKVAAYDALFAGIDNNGNEIVDDIADTGAAVVLTGPAPTPNYNTCPPTNSVDNDPTDGLPTLDAIEAGAGLINYDCVMPLIDHMISLYGLPNGVDGGFDLDPWNRKFKWGYEGATRDDGTLMETTDRRYHRFYSSGPADDDIMDDIVFGG